MDNLHFSASTVAGYAAAGICMMLLAVILVLLWQKRTHAPLMPMIAGAIVFPLFALVLKIPIALPLLYLDNSVSRAILAAPWLYALVAGLLAGLLEETGRFIAFRLLRKKFTAGETAVSYGIGHGGFECLYIGITTLSIVIMALLVNTGNTAELTKNLTPEQMPAAMEQLQTYADRSFGVLMLGVVERLSSMMLQIGLSVLVFAAAYDRKKLWLYPLAMLLHTVIDYLCVRFSTANLLVFEALLLTGGVLLLVLAVRFVYLPYKAKEASA